MYSDKCNKDKLKVNFAIVLTISYFQRTEHLKAVKQTKMFTIEINDKIVIDPHFHISSALSIKFHITSNVVL